MQGLHAAIILNKFLIKSLSMKTRKHFFSSILSLLLLVTSMAGCKKDKDDNNNNNRNVKYEITGNFSGKLDIIIGDNESGYQTIYNVAVPWSKEVIYKSSVISVGLGIASATEGAAGQTAVLKIYSGGNVVKSANGTATSDGYLVIPPLSHSF
jgi:hypothetical protein